MKRIFLLIFIMVSQYSFGQKFYDFCQSNGHQICPSYNKMNCVQFMDYAIKKHLKINSPELTKYIYINYPKETIQKALNTNNVSIVGGVSYGLVKHNLATWVELKDIKKGDIVQYWSTDGFLNGHCGIFHGYDKFGNMILVGSHQDSHGYGYMNVFNQNLKCNFYICRLNND